MPEHPFHPRFTACYERSFDLSLRKLGFAGPNFDFFWRAVEAELLDYPWEYSRELPNSDGLRIRHTRGAFQDIPALLVYFKVDPVKEFVRFVGLSPDWSDDEVFRRPD